MRGHESKWQMSNRARHGGIQPTVSSSLFLFCVLFVCLSVCPELADSVGHTHLQIREHLDLAGVISVH